MSTLIVEVCQIKDIQPIPKADRLELAFIKGWNCVVQKGRFSIGDKAVYIPIDSILPQDLENILFGEGTKIKLNKGRIRTIKLRGVVSQGLITGLSEVGLSPDLKVGTNVQEKLGIIKWEPPTSNRAITKGNQTSKKQVNPHFTKYTNIENIKNYPDVLLGEEVIITEKIHGSNWRAGYVPVILRKFYQKLFNKFFNYYKGKQEFVYGSHNVQLQYKLLKESKHFNDMFGRNIYWEMVQKYNIIDKLKQVYPKVNIILYGEAYGDGVQKNYHYECKQGEHKLVIIDVKIGGEYVDTLTAFNVALNLGLEFVPILYQGILEEDTISKIDMSHSVLAPSQKVMEGIVIRRVKEKQSHIGRSIVKYLNPDYLLNKSNTDWH